MPHLSPICDTSPAHLIPFYFIIRKILDEGYGSLSYTLCSFLHSPVTSSLLGPNILNTLFSTTLLLMSYQSISPGSRLSVWIFRNKTRFYGEELLASRPNTKLEDHPLSVVCDCLFYIFATTLHTGGSSSIRNLRTCLDMVTGTFLYRSYIYIYI